MKVCFVLLKCVPLRKEEITFVAQEPLLRDDVSVLLVRVPVEVSGLVESFEADGASYPHAAEAALAVGRGRVGLENCHAGEVHLAGGAHQPAVDNVFKMHLQIAND